MAAAAGDHAIPDGHPIAGGTRAPDAAHLDASGISVQLDSVKRDQRRARSRGLDENPGAIVCKAVIVDHGIGDVDLGRDAIRWNDRDALTVAAVAGIVAVDRAVLDVQRGTSEKKDAGEASTNTLKGQVAKPHDDGVALAVDLGSR